MFIRKIFCFRKPLSDRSNGELGFDENFEPILDLHKFVVDGWLGYERIHIDSFPEVLFYYNNLLFALHIFSLYYSSCLFACAAPNKSQWE